MIGPTPAVSSAVADDCGGRGDIIHQRQPSACARVFNSGQRLGVLPREIVDGRLEGGREVQTEDAEEPRAHNGLISCLLDISLLKCSCWTISCPAKRGLV